MIPANTLHNTSNGRTRLHIVSMQKNLPLIKLLLTQGANPQAKDALGWTPLHEACGAGCPFVVKALLQAGADPNAPSHTGETPAMIAAAHGHFHTLKTLKEFKADFTAQDKMGNTISHIAQINGHLHTAKWLKTQNEPTKETPKNDYLHKKLAALTRNKFHSPNKGE